VATGWAGVVGTDIVGVPPAGLPNWATKKAEEQSPA